MTGIEQYVRVRVCASGPDEAETLPVLLRYDPATDPALVGLAFPGTEGAHDHVFARALLEEGLRSPAGTACLRVWPCGRAQTVLELRRAAGPLLVLQCDSTDLIRFLRRTYTAAARYEAGLTGPVHEAPRATGQAGATGKAGAAVRTVTGAADPAGAGRSGVAGQPGVPSAAPGPAGPPVSTRSRSSA
ncbi:SsgA family sporulation/cell division regulator [Streptomyces sp. NPDC004959]|uniref:SsgA family sporulation/cell division regulator n=1 Tax=Streptomyces sp. NPDC004959 TaxID=3154673 RepID=UPI0033B6FC20